MNEDRPAMIESRLRAAMTVDDLEIVDDSHRHRGHAGARAGGGHFRVRVVSPDFAGKGTIARHRMVYAAMGDAMRADVIHALSIRALTPAEANADAGEG
ncbi:BolA family protein [Arhodomonas sp. AD133]|uniref:BolA family protein n=1 Tax=Arhodomonas sp. AD133 TaxID=3415009 RepID=UPI003EBE005B